MAIPFVDLKTQYNALSNDIKNSIDKVLDHGQYILGPEVQECEEQLSQFIGGAKVLTCASGTDALIMALLAADVGPGDEVIVPAFSFFATAETVALLGATPVFVDIKESSCNMDPDKLSQAISDKTKAIMPVSLYGQAADMDEIEEVAKTKNIVVIEDAAQSFGAQYKDRKSGALGHISCTSFFPAKPLGCYGDGGAVTTDNPDLALKLEQIRNHGQEKRYYHSRIGINGRMDTIQAAILSVKLGRYPQEIQRRQAAAEYYTEKLSPLQKFGLKTPVIDAEKTSVWAQYTLRVPERAKLQERLKELGVPTAVHYPKTMADQPALSERGRTLDINVSRKAAEEVMSIPMHGDLEKEVQDQICDAISKSIEM